MEKKEQHYKTVKQKAKNIANNNDLNESQRLAAYQHLNKEMSKADLIIASRNIENNKQQSDAEVVSKNDFDQHISDYGYQVSEIKL